MGRVRHSKSLRRRLFGSHLVVMAVALVVLALVVGLIELSGIHLGRQGDGPTGPLLGLLAAAVASALVSLRISRRLAAPLEEISDATRELAAGNYNLRLDPVGTAELDTLVEDVNQLAQDLDTTEQRRLRLIGDVAHELRNPLSTIEGTMEALLDGVVEPGEDTYARVGREAARLRRLADDLSSLSAAGELTVGSSEHVDLTQLCADVVAQLEPQAAAKDLTLQNTLGWLPIVLGDRDRLTQVLMNVIGNAVQYTDQGSIVVSSPTAPGWAVIDVTDSGRGLAHDDQVRIFDRFHRVDGQFTDGTGVGLAIAKLIVDAHGGRIGAHSAGPGSGTTVRIELPAAPAPS